jgi:drug/metabolite transporter (DMT)-like permease
VKRLGGAVSLSVYMIGFSLAYRSLDAGAGALILFGATQIVMFGMSGLMGAAASTRQIVGAGIAFAGLAWVLWPGAGADIPPLGAALMLAAGAGWAVYSLIGRTETDALAASAANFCLSLPLVGLVWVGSGDLGPISFTGVALAVVSGAITSGLGYALWYRVLPMISGVTAATVMLSVPVIALLAGAAFLGEALSSRLILATMVVLGGIAIAVRPARMR